MKKRHEQKAINRLHVLMSSGDSNHKGYTYFVTGTPGKGYRWELPNAAGDTVCMSEKVSGKRDCLRLLRVAQKHAATMHVVDESAT